MTYIILASGKGTNLYPMTIKKPKCLYMLDERTTVIERMIQSIRKNDLSAEIVVVIGYLGDSIKNELYDLNVKFVVNPFYEITNSVATVWFARDYLERENVTIIHGDIVFDDDIIEKYLTKETNYPYVLVDTSYLKEGLYNVVIQDDSVLVMSKKLETFDAKYACMTKLDAVSSRLVKKEIETMINTGLYREFFEDSIVQMIMFHDFQLYYKDIKSYGWSEIDTVDDLINAKKLHRKSRYN